MDQNLIDPKAFEFAVGQILTWSSKNGHFC